MSKLNTNSNGYTIGFMIGMVLVVGGILASVSIKAKSTIDLNVEYDNKSKILNSVGYSGTEVINDYNSKITAIAVNDKGEVIEGVNGYDIVLKKEYRKSVTERQFPVFIYKNEGKVNYILPLIGLGLWDEVNGFAAFNSDFKTLKGVAFDHVGETPGLGAVITESRFEDLFKEKVIFDKNNDYVLQILKFGKSKGGESEVDGLAGATLTTEGMDNMMRNCIPNYKNYFNSLKK